MSGDIENRSSQHLSDQLDILSTTAKEASHVC